MTALLGVIFVATVSEHAAAQAGPPRSEPTYILTANPLGFLQFGPTVEGEAMLGTAAGAAIGLRIPTLGLLSHVIDDQLGFAWLGMGSLRFYFDADPSPRGWWAGPRAEWGKANSGGETYTVYGGGLEFGHRWIFKSRATLSVGAIAGAFKSESGLEGKFVMGVLSLGRVLP